MYEGKRVSRIGLTAQLSADVRHPFDAVSCDGVHHSSIVSSLRPWNLGNSLGHLGWGFRRSHRA